MNRRTAAAIASALVALALPLLADTAHAQNVPVDSRAGYVIRLTNGALLDSSRSGWSYKGRYEQRVYTIGQIGEIRIIATIRPAEVPDGATITEAYVWFDSDSATDAGTAFIRTYYLPTRNVRIELIPRDPGMLRVIEGREAIYNTFRWKPGSESDRADVDGK